MPRVNCKFLLIILLCVISKTSLAQTQSVDNKNYRPSKMMQNDPVGTLFNDGPRVVYPIDFIVDPIEKLFWDKGFSNQYLPDNADIKKDVINSIDVQNPNFNVPVAPPIQDRSEVVAEVNLSPKKSQNANEKSAAIINPGSSSDNILSTSQANKNTQAKVNQNFENKTGFKSSPSKEIIKYSGFKQHSAQWPVKEKPINTFGATGTEGQPWRGLVFQVPINTTVRAIDGGKVIFADYFKNYGNLIIVSHGNNITSVYANNRELTKKEGDLVRRGDVIALSGKASFLGYPALYFEVRDDGKPINPVLLLEIL